MNTATIKGFIRHPRLFLEALLAHCAVLFKNDKLFLSLRWWCRMGYKLDWKNPQTFCEKLQWLKLYNRNPLYTKLVDKYAVKSYVADIIGEEHIIPTLGVWERAEDIDFDTLPDKFVLKTTHGGGSCGVVICKDKSTFDKKAAICKLNKSLKSDIYLNLREWPYKDVPRRIIAEQYMEDYGIDTTCLTDYKFYCFNGEPRYCQVIRDRNTEETIDFFDMNWEHQEFIGLNPHVKHAISAISKPQHFEAMKKIAASLAEGIPFSRIDLYEINGYEYFGEITLFPASGMGQFTPDRYDEILGKMLTLPGKKQGGGIFSIQSTEFAQRSAEITDLHDIKIFCFQGEAQFFKIDFGRFVEHHANYYDRDLNLLPFGELAFPPKPSISVKIPNTIHKMFALAEILSKNIPFLRVDFYDVNGHIYFGEMTFYPASGLGRFTPDRYDEILGKMLTLPGKKQGGVSN